MSWIFTPDKPVFIQIAERMTRFIISGEYPAGKQIPTVRQIALEATVNPNTVQKALTLLESEGLIFSKSTLGKFVTEDKSLIDSYRKKVAQKTAESFLINMKEIGLSPEESIEILESKLKELSTENII